MALASITISSLFRAGWLTISPIKISSGATFALPVRHGHWFTKYYTRKKLVRPISKEVLEKYKERSGVKLPSSESSPSLLRKYLDDSVPESVKKIHSFEFMNLDAAIDEVTKETIVNVGLDPTEDSTAHEIVRLTVQIRVQREQMNKRNSQLIERRLFEMLDRRRDLIRLLRSEDYARFLSLAQALELDYQHQPRPGEAEPPRAGFPARLAETRDRCHRLKLRRLADLAGQMEAAKGGFVQRREVALKDAGEKLAGLGLTLDQVLNEVYADRRERAERDLLEDQLQWYYGEQRAHIKYLAKQAEKAKAAQSRGRK